MADVFLATYGGFPAQRFDPTSPRGLGGSTKRAANLAHAPTAAQALERFELPKDAVDRISELLAPGSALIVSDNALSDETGLETDFIVTTQ